MFEMNIIDVVCSLIVLISFIFIMISVTKSRNNNPVLVKKEGNPKIAFLIPARYEAKVIGNLLASIQRQTVKVDMQDVYVIVESEKDETCLICQEFGASVVVRKELDKKRKGYALDEGMKYILKQGKHYDMYFIMDADNILTDNYLEKMLPTYYAGYQVGVGYRNTKNGNDNMIAACSSLTFSMINTLLNKVKNKEHRTITVSGTGFYIEGNLMESFEGFPFNSLTEDYEFSLYCTLHGITTYYNDTAIYYDEQPTSFKITVKQRSRWVKGFFQARNKYIRDIRKSARKKNPNQGSQIAEAIGITPIIWCIMAFFIYILSNCWLVISSIYNGISFKEPLLAIIVSLFLIYYFLLLFTAFMIAKEGDKLNMNRETRMKALFFNPLFLISYIECALIALFDRNLGWDKIEHKTNAIK